MDRDLLVAVLRQRQPAGYLGLPLPRAVELRLLHGGDPGVAVLYRVAHELPDTERHRFGDGVD